MNDCDAAMCALFDVRMVLPGGVMNETQAQMILEHVLAALARAKSAVRNAHELYAAALDDAPPSEYIFPQCAGAAGGCPVCTLASAVEAIENVLISLIRRDCTNNQALAAESVTTALSHLQQAQAQLASMRAMCT